jgi:hypothetical protein
MGQINTAQATAIIDSVADVVAASNPAPVVNPDPNYWWLLWIGLAPAIVVPFFLWIKKALSKKKKKGKLP